MINLTVNQPSEPFGRVLLFVAHPDDETIACSGLLQRAASSLVVFAVDGAPAYYGFERKFGSLRNYSEKRFCEASRVLSHIPGCALRRLAQPDGTPFMDQHLFQEMPPALASLHQIVDQFSPDLLVSHAFEGGHIDHDACHILAKRTAQALTLPALEFPLYWKSDHGRDIFQKFRGSHREEIILHLTTEETRRKQKMLEEYRTQRALLSVFQPETERFRAFSEEENVNPTWPGYSFENRTQPLKTEILLQKISELAPFPLISLASPSLGEPAQRPLLK